MTVKVIATHTQNSATEQELLSGLLPEHIKVIPYVDQGENRKGYALDNGCYWECWADNGQGLYLEMEVDGPWPDQLEQAYKDLFPHYLVSSLGAPFADRLRPA